jgi:hypothetical protein
MPRCGEHKCALALRCVLFICTGKALRSIGRHNGRSGLVSQAAPAGQEPDMALSFSQSMSLLTSSRRHTLTAPPTVVAAAAAASSTAGSSRGRQLHQHHRQRGRHLVSWQLAHGCLHGHLLAGEESFRVEWDKEDDSVW